MKRRNLLFLAVAALAVTVTGPGFAGAPAERATHDRFVDTTRDTDAEIYGTTQINTAPQRAISHRRKRMWHSSASRG
jgi:hypothetical protein